MRLLSERERDSERPFRQDQESVFRILHRSNELVGLWGAELIGLPAEDAQAYAQQVARRHMASPDVISVRDALRADLERARVSVSDAEIEAKIRQTRTQAECELRGD